jgi:photosystem II stability/assembly factor-like uncharacterized protein
MALIASTRSGLYRIRETGISPGFCAGIPFLALAADTDADTGRGFAATQGGDIYRTDDAGGTWSPVGKIEGFVELSSLAVLPRRGGGAEVLLAGMEPAALFRSEDGGRTWQEDSRMREMSGDHGWSVPWSDTPGHVREIAIDPGDPARIYLAIEVGGIVRSEDGGATWENIREGPDVAIHDDVHTVAVRPGDGRTIYAATRHGFGRSDDYGCTWTAANPFEGQGYSRPLAVDPSNGDRIFSAASPVGPGSFDRPEVGAECGVFRSDDGGRRWRRLKGGLPERFIAYVDALAVDPLDLDHVALCDSSGHLYESRDDGRHWTLTAQLPGIRRLRFVGA